MGVYVFDMEMPKNCAACPLRASCVHRIYLERRADYCPLVYVPPHGRLIDADARVNVQMYYDEFEDYQTVNMSIDDLLDSSWIELEDDPTIIPADPAEEGET